MGFLSALLCASALAASAEPGTSAHFDRLLTVARYSGSGRTELVSKGVRHIPVYSSYLRPKASIELESGEVVKLQGSARSGLPVVDAPQCFLKNQNRHAAALKPGKRLDLISVLGSGREGRYWDWEFVLLGPGSEPGFSLHCEFPRGASAKEVHSRLKDALGRRFEFFPSAPTYLDVRDLPSTASAQAAVESP